MYVLLYYFIFIYIFTTDISLRSSFVGFFHYLYFFSPNTNDESFEKKKRKYKYRFLNMDLTCFNFIILHTLLREFCLILNKISLSAMREENRNVFRESSRKIKAITENLIHHVNSVYSKTKIKYNRICSRCRNVLNIIFTTNLHHQNEN